MQHVSNITSLQSYQQTSSSEKRQQQSTETGQTHQSKANVIPYNTLRVWDRFTQIYGRSFLTEFGELPNEAWIEEIEKLSPQDVERGIKASQASGSDFAPRLPRFLAMCQPPIVEDVYKQERETQLLLERRRNVQSTPEVRRAELAKMKADLVTFKPQGEMR